MPQLVLLSQEPRSKQSELDELATQISLRHSVSVERVELSWALQQPGVSAILISPASLEEFQRFGLAQPNWLLPKDDLNLLDNASRGPAPYLTETSKSGTKKPTGAVSADNSSKQYKKQHDGVERTLLHQTEHFGTLRNKRI